MSSIGFLTSFNKLKDKWLPDLELNLKTIGQPKVERVKYNISAAFKIKVAVTQERLSGNRGYNCSDVNEVSQEINKISSAGCSGNSDVLNKNLKEFLNKNNLLDLLNKGIFQLGSYSYSCLIACENCSSHGSVTCTGCSGSGSVKQLYQIQTGDTIYRNNQGQEIGRIPVYSTGSKWITCGSCSGSGWLRCNKCSGDGVNTFKKTAGFYSCSVKPMRNWSRFTDLLWAEDYVKKGGDSYFNINKIVEWSYSNQIVHEGGQPGVYKVTLPGLLTASQCEIEVTSRYSESTSGLCKKIGAAPYDTDFVFNNHVNWVYFKKSKVELKAKELAPLLSSPLVEACVVDLNSYSVPPGELNYLNLIKSETAKSLRCLIRKLESTHKADRESLSVFKLFINTLFAGLSVFSLIVFAQFISNDFDVNRFGLFPMTVNLFHVVKLVIESSLKQIGGYIDVEMLVYLTVAFIPSLLLMKILGLNSEITVRRILKWYFLGGLFIVSFLLQFENDFISYSYAKSTTPILDLIIVSFFMGVLLTRKGSYSRQKKSAEEYKSKQLMRLLDYKD